MQEATGRLSQGFIPKDDESVGEPAGAVDDLTDRVKQKSRDALSGAAERGKDKLAGRAEGVAHALHHASESLQSEELSRYTDRIANKLEQLAGSLKSRDLASLTNEVTRFARLQPALFLGGAFTAGLLAARFLKSSAGEARAFRPSGQSQSAFDHARSDGIIQDRLTMSDERDSESLEQEVTSPSGFGPVPGGYGPASAPGGAHGGSGTFGAEGAGGGPGNDPAPVGSNT